MTGISAAEVDGILHDRPLAPSIVRGLKHRRARLAVYPAYAPDIVRLHEQQLVWERKTISKNTFSNDV